MRKILSKIYQCILVFVLLFCRATTAGTATPPSITLSDLLAKGSLNTPYTVSAWVVGPIMPDWTILRDETGGIFAADECHVCQKPGTRIIATVIRHSGTLPDGNPTTHASVKATQTLGVDPDLVRPIDISPADMSHPELYDYRRVTVRGTVTEVIHDELDPGWVFLFVEAGGNRAVVPIMLVKDNLPFPTDEALVDAEIAATGIFLANANSGRRHLGPHVANYDGHAVRITRPAPKDPFADCPDADMDAVSVSKAKHDGHRRRATGKVLAIFDERSAFLALPTGKRLRIRFAPHAELPSVGSVIDTVGFVRSNVFFPRLANALWRESRSRDLMPAEVPEDVPARDLLFDKAGQRCVQDSCDGRIVRLCGRVTDVIPTSDGRKTINLNSDGITVNADAPPTVAPAVGSVVAVTGVCLLQDTADGSDDFVRLEGFSVILRTSADLVVVSAPSWWTTQRLLFALALATAIILVALVWNALLQRLAEQRGRQLAQAKIDQEQSELKKTERTRLSAELHDSLSQSLTGIVLQLDASQHARPSDAAAADRHLDAAQRMLQGCRTELRRCIWDLRSSALDDPDFEQAIRTSLHPIVCKAHLTVRSHVPRELLSDNMAHAVLRILRELAANALRHGKASTVRIAGDISTGPLKFSVTDDGCGFPVENPPGPEDGHFGLMGIRERLREMGGSITIESVKPHGTKATFIIPFPNESAKMKS